MKRITLCNWLCSSSWFFAGASGTLQWKIDIPDFENLSVWQIEVVNSFFVVIHARSDVKIDICVSIIPLTTKFGKQVYLEEFIKKKLTKQVLETWLWKNVLTFFYQGLWSSNLEKVLQRLKTLYLYYQRSYGQQTWQDVNLTWWALTYKKHVPMTTWSCGFTWQFKRFYLHYYVAYSHEAWHDGNVPWEAPTPSYSNLWLSGITSSRGKLKLLYLHYHSASGHKTWQDGDLP